MRRNRRAYGGVRWFATVDEILADASIQGVLVETSPFEGVAWPRRALEAGKHVHLDKAPGTSLAAFAQVIDLARCIATGEAPRVSYDHDLLVHEVLLRACGVAV